MAKFPTVACNFCMSNKNLIYQKELSIVDRKNPEKNIPCYWCSKCELLLQIRTSIVTDSIKAVRATVTKNKKGRGIYEFRKKSGKRQKLD